MLLENWRNIKINKAVDCVDKEHLDENVVIPKIKTWSFGDGFKKSSQNIETTQFFSESKKDLDDFFESMNFSDTESERLDEKNAIRLQEGPGAGYEIMFKALKVKNVKLIKKEEEKDAPGYYNFEFEADIIKDSYDWQAAGYDWFVSTDEGAGQVELSGKVYGEYSYWDRIDPDKADDWAKYDIASEEYDIGDLYGGGWTHSNLPEDLTLESVEGDNYHYSTSIDKSPDRSGYKCAYIMKAELKVDAEFLNSEIEYFRYGDDEENYGTPDPDQDYEVDPDEFYKDEEGSYYGYDKKEFSESKRVRESKNFKVGDSVVYKRKGGYSIHNFLGGSLVNIQNHHEDIIVPISDIRLSKKMDESENISFSFGEEIDRVFRDSDVKVIESYRTKEDGYIIWVVVTDNLNQFSLSNLLDNVQYFCECHEGLSYDLYEGDYGLYSRKFEFYFYDYWKESKDTDSKLTEESEVYNYMKISKSALKRFENFFNKMSKINHFTLATSTMLNIVNKIKEQELVNDCYPLDYYSYHEFEKYLDAFRKYFKVERTIVKNTKPFDNFIRNIDSLTKELCKIVEESRKIAFKESDKKEYKVIVSCPNENILDSMFDVLPDILFDYNGDATYGYEGTTAFYVSFENKEDAEEFASNINPEDGVEARLEESIVHNDITDSNTVQELIDFASQTAEDAKKVAVEAEELRKCTRDLTSPRKYRVGKKSFRTSAEAVAYQQSLDESSVLSLYNSPLCFVVKKLETGEYLSLTEDGKHDFTKELDFAEAYETMSDAEDAINNIVYPKRNENESKDDYYDRLADFEDSGEYDNAISAYKIEPVRVKPIRESKLSEASTSYDTYPNNITKMTLDHNGDRKSYWLKPHQIDTSNHGRDDWELKIRSDYDKKYRQEADTWLDSNADAWKKENDDYNLLQNKYDDVVNQLKAEAKETEEYKNLSKERTRALKYSDLAYHKGWDTTAKKQEELANRLAIECNTFVKQYVDSHIDKELLDKYKNHKDNYFDEFEGIFTSNRDSMESEISKRKADIENSLKGKEIYYGKLKSSPESSFFYKKSDGVYTRIGSNSFSSKPYGRYRGYTEYYEVPDATQVFEDVNEADIEDLQKVKNNQVLVGEMDSTD